MSDKDIIEKFLKAGRDASYHYADDSGREWQTGNKFKNVAMGLYDAHPDMQKEMLKKADFLWSLESELDLRHLRRMREIGTVMARDIAIHGGWGMAATDAKKAYPEVDPTIIEAMAHAMYIYKEKEK